jgi:hypothetical protein
MPSPTGRRSGSSCPPTARELKNASALGDADGTALLDGKVMPDGTAILDGKEILDGISI